MQGDGGVVDAYVAGVISRSHDESDLNGVKLAAFAARAGQSGERTVFYIRECPLKESCSARSWHMVKPWSFDTADGALEMLKKHLTNSSLHAVDEADADELLATAEVESYIDKGENNNTGQEVIGNHGRDGQGPRKGAGKVGKAGRAPARAA